MKGLQFQGWLLCYMHVGQTLCFCRLYSVFCAIRKSLIKYLNLWLCNYIAPNEGIELLGLVKIIKATLK